MGTVRARRVWVCSDEDDDAGALIEDVTEGVQALYDHLVSSMDWGSGFLSDEEVRDILKLARACGFVVPDDAAGLFDKYVKQFGATCATCLATIAWNHVARAWRHTHLMREVEADHEPVLADWKGTTDA